MYTLFHYLQKKKNIELQTWLNSIGMQTYFSLFVREQMFLEELSFLDDPLLNRLNINLMGHRLRLLKGAKELNKSSTKPSKCVFIHILQ